VETRAVLPKLTAYEKELLRPKSYFVNKNTIQESRPAATIGEKAFLIVQPASKDYSNKKNGIGS
jgi:hypothetical protein